MSTLECLPKFPLGELVIAPLARLLLTQVDIDVDLTRHQAGDWGDLSPSDWAATDQALQQGLGVLSVFRLTNGSPFIVDAGAAKRRNG